jgi:uncharacterized SAM-binding protein YcdF (DUF218 family)
MLYILSRIVQALILPPASLLLLMLAGALLLRRHRTAGRSLIALGIFLLYLLSLPLTADLLIRPLEASAPPLGVKVVHADAIVVLGSGVMDLSWVPAPAQPSDTATSRLVTGIWLAKQGGRPLVLSGGSGEIAGGKVLEADAMADLAVRLGIPREQIKIDRLSRTTRENASAVRTLVAGDDIILVTSAFHMSRAKAFFSKQGFTVIPAPTAYRAQSRPSSLSNLLPRPGHLETSALGLSEYLSTSWYRLRGLI